MKHKILLVLAFSMVLMVSIQGQGEAKPSELKTGDIATFELPGGATMEMVWIEPGAFTMGTTEEQEQLLRSKGMWSDWPFENEHPDHPVTITKGFYLGKVEITQGQWEVVMGTTPWSGRDYVQENANNPAEYISWNDVQGFIGNLNDVEGFEVYRLPTEAEWEYACRAGTTTQWSFGEDESQLKEYAWYEDNPWNSGERYAYAVGTKLPNPWGLHDMHGNVWEWCQDWYAEDYYDSSPSEDPVGPPSGSNRVLRGGSFDYPARDTRSAIRGYLPSSYRGCRAGARLVRQGDAPSPVSPSTWGQVKSLLE